MSTVTKELEAWRARRRNLAPNLRALDDDTDAGAFDRAFEMLSIIDTKASALFAADALLAGLLALFIGYAREAEHGGPWTLWLASVQLFLSVISAIICFEAVWLEWGALERPGSPGASADLDKLAGIVIRRTFLFRTAWYLTRVSLWLLFVLVILYVAA